MVFYKICEKIKVVSSLELPLQIIATPLYASPAPKGGGGVCDDAVLSVYRADRWSFQYLVTFGEYTNEIETQ